MADIPGSDRDAVLALVTEALRNAGRTVPPPETEKGDRLRGNAKWSEPDEHGWVALIPVQFDVWMRKLWSPGRWRFSRAIFSSPIG